MKDTLLTDESAQLLIDFAHAFRGYEYEKQNWGLTDEQMHKQLPDLLKYTQATGKFSSRAGDNFAVNYHLHRNFHHQGFLPAAHTPDWYDMLFYYLHLYRIPIPMAFHDPEQGKNWVQRRKGAAETAAAEIRQLLRRR